MEWSWRTVLILVGLIGMAAILVDGFRRMKRNRAEALKLDVGPAAEIPEDDFNPELPGTVRVVKAAESDYSSRFRDAEPIRPVVSEHDYEPEAQDAEEPAIVDNLEALRAEEDEQRADASLEDASGMSALDNSEEPLISMPESEARIPQSPLIPTPKPVDLDEKVPVLLDVEELGDEESFAEGIISAPRVVSSPMSATPEAETSSSEHEVKSDHTAEDITEPESHTPADDTDAELLVVEDPEAIDDPHLEHEVEALPEDLDSIPANVNYAGPGAEVLANRPDAELVLVIHTIARNPDGFSGAELLFLFNSCDLRYREKDIFHRFEEAGGEGCIQFSVAQMRNPGVFDPAIMADQSFSGLSFFMSLPGAKRPLEAYEAMSEMAMVVSRNLKADVLDGDHSAMTPQTMEHERQQILDFERKRRLAAKKQKV